MSAPARDLLMASPERWDECCFAVPAVRALQAAGMGVGVLCQAHQLAFWRTLAEVEVLVEDVEGDWRSALLWEDGALAKAVVRARIARRIGPAVGKLPKRLTHPLQHAPHPTEHRVQFYLKALGEMGIDTAKPEFFAPASHAAASAESALLLAPDSDFGPSHEWGLGRWKEVAATLLEKGRRLTIACLTQGRGLGRQLAASLHEQADALPVNLAAPPLSLLSSFPQILAADGSLPHLAAHMGATCVTLFGPNDPAWRRPLGKRHQVIHRHVECAPCRLPKCPLDLRCQKEMDVAMVLARGW
ncbi:MAG TPA: glycosyltransferase family 9 protein [Luteolibacter sp.]|nr:glycosyltransferase family 9 protein [Luteolibacter sp.]